MSTKQRKKAGASGTDKQNGSARSIRSAPLSASLTADDDASAARTLASSEQPSAAPATLHAGRPPAVSSFIGKLYSIVSNPATQHIISWADHGQSFLVKDEYAFSLHIMRQHFRHSNFSSFVRQLNFYGFHKRSTPSAVTQVHTAPHLTTHA